MPDHLMRQRDIAGALRSFAHPWNPRSEMRGVPLGARAGFRRIGVNFIRIPPGKEAYVPHAHAQEEEWVYILEGRARAVVGEETFDVGPGDFLAFPAPQVVHHLANAGSGDLVCLMGGEVLPLDVVDFPRQGKRMVWVDGKATAYDLASGVNPFTPRPDEPLQPELGLDTLELFSSKREARVKPAAKAKLNSRARAKSKAPARASPAAKPAARTKARPRPQAKTAVRRNKARR